MNNTTVDKQHLDLLYSLPDVVWMKLRDSQVFNVILNSATSPVSLTLTRDLITSIATGRNRKWRRKNIDTLVKLLSVDNLQGKVRGNGYPEYNLPLTLYWLVMLCDIYKSQLVKTVIDVEVKVHTKDNSPAYTPYIIGDSIHYNSCLRCGVVNYYKSTGNDAPNQVDSAVYDNVHNHNEWTAGCNFEYTLEDHAAFHRGELIYLTVGDLCDVNNVGPEARLRVVVTRNTGTYDTIYVMHNLYGNMKYGQALVSKLLQMYPDKVYSFSESCNYLELSEDSVSIVSVPGYYEDDRNAAYKVLSVRTNTSSAKISYSDPSRWIVITHNNITARNYLRTSHKVQRNLYKLIRNTRKPVQLYNVGSPDDALAYSQSYILSKFNIPHELYYKFNGWGYLSVSQDSPVYCRDESVTWSFRGKRYTLNLVNSACVLTNSIGLNYNVKTGTWVKPWLVQNRHDTHITRHTIHMIDKFLPRRRDALTLRVVPVVSED